MNSITKISRLMLLLTTAVIVKGAWHFTGTPFDCSPYQVGPSANGPGGGMACTMLAGCTNGSFSQNITLDFDPSIGWDCNNGITITGTVSGEAISTADPLNDYLNTHARGEIWRNGIGSPPDTWTNNSWKFCDGYYIGGYSVYYGPNC